MIESSHMSTTLTKLAADVTVAFVENNSIPAGDVPALIQLVFTALASAAQPPPAAVSSTMQAPKAPAISLKKSVTQDYLICLEDGLKFKTLKRHLRSKHNMSPEDYRAKWNLPESYPMAAPTYAAARSALAKANGLGASRRRAKPKPVPKKRTAAKP